MNLEKLSGEQSAMQERSRVVRTRQAKKNATRKKKRDRFSVRKLLIPLAQDSKASGKVRAWAIQQLLLLSGKPVQPFEEPNEEPKPETPIAPVVRGSDLGTDYPRI